MTNFLRELPAGALWPAGSPPGLPPVVPSSLRGPNMETLLGAVGLQLDCMAEQSLWSRVQAVPSAGRLGGPVALLADGRRIECEPWVLQLIAQQRGIPLYPTEGPQSQRQRLAQFWQLHARRGQHLGVFQHVRPYFNDFVFDPVTGSPTGNGYPAMDCAFQTGDGQTWWHRMSAAGAYSIYRPATSNFNYDGRYASNRCRAFYFIRMSGTGFTPPWVYDSGPDYDTGYLYDVGGTTPFALGRMQDTTQMILDWSAETTWVNVVAYVWDPAAVDPTSTPTQGGDGRWTLPNGAGTWAALLNPATNLPTRPLGAVFFYVDNAP